MNLARFLSNVIIGYFHFRDLILVFISRSSSSLFLLSLSMIHYAFSYHPSYSFISFYQRYFTIYLLIHYFLDTLLEYLSRQGSKCRSALFSQCPDASAATALCYENKKHEKKVRSRSLSPPFYADLGNHPHEFPTARRWHSGRYFCMVDHIFEANCLSDG